MILRDKVTSAFETNLKDFNHKIDFVLVFSNFLANCSSRIMTSSKSQN